MSDVEPIGPVEPIGYAVVEIITRRPALRNLYASVEAALAGARRLETGKASRFMPVPVYGPDAFSKWEKALAASQHAEDMLRREVVALRNDEAVVKGAAIAEAHGRGQPAPATLPDAPTETPDVETQR